MHVLVVAYALLFVYFALSSAIDHDEVEHAHVAFKMLSGQLPYRDFYQNHLPLYWFLVMPLVSVFPFSINCILAARVLSLLALAGTWYLGLGLLGRIAGGRTQLARLLYTLATIQFALYLESYIARPDSLSTLFATWALCLLAVRDVSSWQRSLAVGVLFGLTLAVSTKNFPLLLVLPVGLALLAIRDRNAKVAGAIVPYAAGGLIAALPTVAWIVRHDLLDPFIFDVMGMNAALSKPLSTSFRFMLLPLFIPAALGIAALAVRALNGGWHNRRVAYVVVTWFALGLSIALIAGHPGEYNVQVIIVPLAIGSAFLVVQAWLRVRGPVFRLLVCAALLAYPTLVTAKAMIRPTSSGRVPLEAMQRIIDLARPGNRTCTAFSPVHPIFCADVSGLSNGWDLLFGMLLPPGAQRDRMLQVWRDGLQATVKERPHIVVEEDGRGVWQTAVNSRLITKEDFDALRAAMKTDYEGEAIEMYRIWRKKEQ